MIYNKYKGGDNMAISQAQQKAVAKYNKKAYDRLEMKVPKGEKENIIAHAEQTDGSLNKFLNRAVNEIIIRDTESQEQNQ